MQETRGKTRVNKLRNELAFARNYLMYEGLIDGSVRGLWKLTEKGQSADITDNYAAQILYRWNKKTKSENGFQEQEDHEPDDRKHTWFPADYNPGFSVDDWVKLLKDESVFKTNSLAIMKRMKDYGGMATCKQLAGKYGDTVNFYNNGSSSLARRIEKATGCPLLEKNTENSKWWPVLYVGKYADKELDGIYIWKLRDELSQALDQVDLSQIPLYADPAKEAHQYWWLTANPKIWSFSDMAVGQIQNYTLYNENGNKRRIFQNFLNAREGDPVIGYESTPEKKMTALAVIHHASNGVKHIH